MVGSLAIEVDAVCRFQVHYQNPAGLEGQMGMDTGECVAVQWQGTLRAAADGRRALLKIDNDREAEI